MKHTISETNISKNINGVSERKYINNRSSKIASYSYADNYADIKQLH